MAPVRGGSEQLSTFVGQIVPSNSGAETNEAAPGQEARAWMVGEDGESRWKRGLVSLSGSRRALKRPRLAGGSKGEGSDAKKDAGNKASATLELAKVRAMQSVQALTGTEKLRVHLKKVLGGGKAGVVWDGEFESQRVAVKVGTCLAADNLLRRERTVYEALASLQGTVIPRLYGSGWTRTGRRFLILEQIQGRTLDRVVMTPDVAAKSEAALAAIHRRGWTHGDVRLPNFMIESKKGAPGRVVILDFGESTRASNCTEGPELRKATEQRWWREILVAARRSPL